MLQPPTKAERQKLLAMGYSNDDIDREFGPEPASVPKGVARSVAQGLPFVGTFADEVEAAVRGVSPKVVEKELTQFRAERPGLAYGSEFGTSLLTGGALAKAAQKMGTSALSKALQYGLQSGTIQGATAGAGAADEGLGSRAMGAVTGGVAGKVLGDLLTPKARVTQRDLPRDIAAATAGLGQNVRVGAIESLRNRAAQTGTRVQRMASDVIAPYAPRVASAIEPTDAIKIQRATEQLFPSNLSVDELETAAGRAAQAAEGLKTEAGAAAGKVKELGKATQQRTRRIEQIGASQAKQEAEAVLDAAEAEAQSVIGTLRGGRKAADTMRDRIRGIQLAEGKESYDAVRTIGAPPEPDPEIYREVLRDPVLKKGYQKAYQALRKEAQNVEPGMPVAQELRRVAIGERVLPELSLEMFDNIRRHVFDQPVMSKMNATGISASQRRGLIQQIDRMEERFLAGYGSDDAANAIRAARQQYRARFEQLEALKDGLSLGAAKAGKTPGLLKPNRMDLDELSRRVDGYSDEAKEAFKVGAAKWFDNLVQEGMTKDALDMVKKATKSEASIRRLRLAFDDETVDKMVQIAGAEAQAAAQTGATQQRAAQLAERARQQGAQRVGAVEAEAQRLAQELAQQQGRASSLEATASAAKRFRTALGESPSALEAQQGFLNVALPALGNEGIAALQQYGSAAIKRELSGLTLEQARQRIAELQVNPAARQLFTTELNRIAQAAQPGPRVVRPAISRFTGGGLSNILMGRE